MNRIILMIAAWMLAAGMAVAQEATVKRVELNPMDLSGKKYQRLDLNGEPCALVKVEVLANDVEFSGNVIEPVEHRTGEYWVYMVQGTKMLRINSGSFLPLMINFTDYDINGLGPNLTYMVTLSLPGFNPQGVGARSAVERPRTHEDFVRQEYDRMRTEVDVSHIMLAHENPTTHVDQRALLNSIRDSILAGVDFDEMARKYSIDPAAKRNGNGHQGYMKACVFPYAFEDAAYTTNPGQISEVISTPMGYHIVKVHARRPNRGEVLVEHIMKLTQGLSADDMAKKKVQIDSIYNLVRNGADFAEIARTESEDPGTAKNGGRLPWFGTGRMVPAFETVAFMLKDGEISKPFTTPYGYHIMRRLEHKNLEPLEILRPKIEEYLSKNKVEEK